MAIVGRLWFRYARIAVIDETSKNRKGIQLVSMLELSVTSSGTYDPWKLWSLMSASQIRIRLVAALALLAAISTSLFVNIIAYEAVSTTRAFTYSRDISLTPLPRFGIGLNMTRVWGVGVRNWAGADSKVVVETTSVLHQLAYGDVQISSGQSWNADTGEYIAVDASRSSLDNVIPGVIELMDVPATRLGIKCTPANITNLGLYEYRDGSDLSKFEATIDIPYGEQQANCRSLAALGSCVSSRC
jgi:hypothetical protein